MSDQTIAGDVPDWASALRPGTVVSFATPGLDQHGRSRVSIRPCLVARVFDAAGQRFAEILPGEAAADPAGSDQALAVRSAAGIAAAGLKGPTRFPADFRLTVSLHNQGFRPAPATGSPVLGQLDPAGQRELVRLLERIAARKAALQARRARSAGTGPDGGHMAP
jgi:hypothetical protein